MMDFNLEHIVAHVLNDLPGETAAAIVLGGVHHAHKLARRFVVSLHIVERIKKVRLQLHNGEQVVGTVVETEVEATVTGLTELTSGGEHEQ